MQIYLADGANQRAVSQEADETALQTWDYPEELGAGTHTIELIFVNDPGQTTSFGGLLVWHK